MTTPQPLDVVALAVAVATALFGPEVALFVGPYAVIVLGAVIGAIWGATRRAASTRGATFLYLAAVIGLAILFTVPLSEMVASTLARYGGPTDARPYFGIVALAIAAIGPDWPKVGQWLASLVRSGIERWAASGKDDPSKGGQQ